jgi:hypothetical protein
MLIAPPGLEFQGINEAQNGEQAAPPDSSVEIGQNYGMFRRIAQLVNTGTQNQDSVSQQ